MLRERDDDVEIFGLFIHFTTSADAAFVWNFRRNVQNELDAINVSSQSNQPSIRASTGIVG